MSKVIQRRQSRSNEAFFLNGYSTVQTSWRPQLPLPKEVNLTGERSQSTTNLYNERLSEMDRNSNKSSSSLNANNSKKWSLGRLFRKKQKDNETESSSDEQDRKAGFSPSQKPRKKDKRKRSSKMIGAGFDHIVISPKNENEFFVPFEQIELPTPPAEQFRSASTNSLDGKSSRKDRKKAVSGRSNTTQLGSIQSNYYPSQQQQKPLCINISSDEEIISMQSNKYRSDDSIGDGSGGAIGNNSNGNNGNGTNRKSRSARTERYYKRMSRDGEVSNGGILPQSTQKITQQMNSDPSHFVQVYNDNPNYLPPNRERHKVLLHPEPQPIVEPVTQMRQATSLNYVAYPTSLQLRHHNIAPGYKVAPLSQAALHQQKLSQMPPKNLQNSITNDKRSISYDSHIHAPSRNLNLSKETRQIQQPQEPPPPPPRDPQRRVHLNNSNNELRPMSFAFDQNTTGSMNKINGRCVSDDKLWGQNKNLYQNMQRPSSIQPAQSVIYSSIGPKQTNQGAFVTQPVRISQTPPPSAKGQLKPPDFRYVADAAPRSRKPIHILNQTTSTASAQALNNEQKNIESPIRTTKSGLLPTASKTIKSASNFWKQIDRQEQHRQGKDYEAQRGIRTAKPRSMSSSRVNEMQAFRNTAFEDILNCNRSQVDRKTPPVRDNLQRSRYDQFSRRVNPAQNSSDEVDNIISGSLLIKPTQDKSNTLVEISSQSDVKSYDKSRSMPNYYQSRTNYSNDHPINFIEMPKPNKYDEYVAKQREQNRLNGLNKERNFSEKSLHSNPTSRKTVQQDNDPTNIEDVINELEAIYKSLNIGGEESSRTSKRPNIPTSKEFETYAKEFKDDSSSEETIEPDVVRDDLALRNMKFSNDIVKTIDSQPPFGIPVGPIPPSPNTDYLHVKPEKDVKKSQYIAHNYPDVITDDLAVRTLRKDSPGRSRPKFQYPNEVLRQKHRATRTQSANIYALIQRDAAKPSGGDLSDYYDYQKSLEKTGSLNDVSRDLDDPPITMQLLKNLRNQEQQYQSGFTPKRTVFRHPSQGGAICNLPTVLKSNEEKQKPPVPLPRKSISPDPIRNRFGMEEALNQIAIEAKESSEKLSRDLLELRKENLLTNPNKNSEKNLNEIETASNNLKRCKEILLEVVPPEQAQSNEAKNIQPRKLNQEKKYLKEIETVSSKANEVRGKLLVGIEKSKPSAEKLEIKTQHKVEINKPSVQDINLKSIKDSNENLTVSNLLKNLDPSSDKIDSITKRCIRHITALDNNGTQSLIKDSENHPITIEYRQHLEVDDSPDYDNLNENLKQMTIAASQIATCKEQQSNKDLNNICTENILVPELNDKKFNKSTGVQMYHAINESSKLKQQQESSPTVDEEEIDKIMKECEKNTIKSDNGSNASSNLNIINTNNHSLDNHKFIVKNDKKSASRDDSSQRCYGSDDAVTTATGCTDGGVDQIEGFFITPIYSSSDCIKSSSPGSFNQQKSSSLTSAHNGGFSSSDYVKSPSSEYISQQSFTSDPIKTFSTTSYDCSTSSATPNLINLSSPICSSDYDNTTNNNSQILVTPSPPLNLTPIGNEVQLKSSSSKKSINKSNSIDSLDSNKNNQSSQYNSSEELAAIFGITRSSSPATVESQISLKAPIATTEASNEILFSDEYTQGNQYKNLIRKSNAKNNNSRKIYQNIALSDSKSNNNTKCFKCNCVKSNNNCNQNVMSDLKLISNTDINPLTNHRINNIFANDTLSKANASKTNASLCFVCSINNDSLANKNNEISYARNPLTEEHKSNENSSHTSSSNTKTLLNNNIQSSVLNMIPELQNESSSPSSNSIDRFCNLPTNSQNPDYISFSHGTNTYSSNVHVVLPETNNIESTNSTNQAATHFDSFSSIDEDNSSNPDSGNVSLSDFPVQQYIHNNSSSFEVELNHNSKFNVSSNFVNEIKIETFIECTNNNNQNNNNDEDDQNTNNEINSVKSTHNNIDLISECINSEIDSIETIINVAIPLKIDESKFDEDDVLSVSSTPDSFKSLDNISDASDVVDGDDANQDKNNIISIQVPLLKQSNQLKFFKPPEYDDDDFYTDDNQLSSIEEEDENLSDCDINDNIDDIESEIDDDYELKQFELLENHFRTSTSADDLPPINLENDSLVNDSQSQRNIVVNEHFVKKDSNTNNENNSSNSNDWKLINQERISLPSTSRDSLAHNSYDDDNDSLSQTTSSAKNSNSNTTTTNRFRNNNSNNHEYNDLNNENRMRDQLLPFSNKLQLAHPDAARTTILEHMIILCTCGLATNEVFTFFAIIVAVITLIAFLLF